MRSEKFRNSEWPLDGRIIQKFEEMTKSSPRGVEDFNRENHIQRVTKYFFTEVCL
jgi:hypothetical protein